MNKDTNSVNEAESTTNHCIPENIWPGFICPFRPLCQRTGEIPMFPILSLLKHNCLSEFKTGQNLLKVKKGEYFTGRKITLFCNSFSS